MSEELDSTRILVEQKNYNETWETEESYKCFQRSDYNDEHEI